MTFRNVSIVCEGTTEADFVKKLNKKYFNAKGISLKPINANIKGKISKDIGGNVSVERVVYFIDRASEIVVTTLIDYYGFQNQKGKTVEEIEKEIKNKSQKEHLIPYLQMHETEALWFSDINIIKNIKNADNSKFCELENIIHQYPNPEDINNSKETAPSKRLEKIFDNYSKVLDGNLISEELSIEKIKEKCPRFSKWLSAIEDKVNQLK